MARPLPTGRILRRLCEGRAVPCAVLLLTLLAAIGPGGAAEVRTADVLGAVVGVRAEVPDTARTAESLGTLREGTGVVIDEDGLVLTIGYLVLEAGIAEIIRSDGRPVPAEIVAYDYESGFGLLRPAHALDIKPMVLGDSGRLAEQEPVLVVSHGNPPAAQAAIVVARREFAGYWEYLLSDAIFTTPPHATFGGAALVGRDGRLLGIGSLIVGDSAGDGSRVPGNMFVPIDRLKPILPDLLKTGRAAGPPRPWLGLFAEEVGGRVLITAVTEGGPAARAGLHPGDRVLAVAGASVESLADFYRKVWAQGEAGVEVPLSVQRSLETTEVAVVSGDRYAWLRLNPTY